MSTVIEQADHAVWEGVRRFAALPDWLDAATQPERFVAAINRAIPEFAAGSLTIYECDIGHVRFKRDFWTGIYELTVGEPGTGERRTIALRGTILPPQASEPARDTYAAFGTDGWQAYLADLNLKLEMRPPDEALPALPILTDPETARALLESSIRSAAPRYHDLQIAACMPKVMRYSPGSRCTILYRLEYPPGLSDGRGWPEIVVAKTYKGGKGKHAYAGMRALWESDFARSGGVTLAEPLAFLPDLNVLVQGPIREERTLQELIGEALRAGTPEALDELHARVRQTAAGLATLHRSDVRFGPVRTWEDELDEVRGVVDNLASALPWVAQAATPLLARLQAAAVAQPADQTMTVHGTFRPGQVLIYRGEIGFIDFDSFCQAEPALDLSLFLRRTKDIALAILNDEENPSQERRAALLTQAETVCEVFLSEYEARVPISRQRVALWEALDLFTLVLHCWTKVKPERLDNSMFALERHLRTIGF
jgi:phosphotransferase family enzyme